MTRPVVSHGVRLDSIAERVEIAPGVMMPRLGLGTSRAHGASLVRAIMSAFDIGYRLLDTSANYDNEEDVGRAIGLSKVPRDEIFITTKLEGSDQGLRSVRPALEGSLRRLGLEYVDLYLVHWPMPELTNDTWQAMEELPSNGLTRAIGVSNFDVSDLEQLSSTGTIMPAVNQIELNPVEQRTEVRAYCDDHGIVVEAWAPVMRGHAGSVPLLAEIGRAHGKTSEQIALRWLLQEGNIAIPKTVHESRLRENADLYDFALSGEEMRAIDALGS